MPIPDDLIEQLRNPASAQALDDALARLDAYIRQTEGDYRAAVLALFDQRLGVDLPLQPNCDCGCRVRVLWSGPISSNSRPVLLVCGWHPQRRCEFRQAIPAEKVNDV